jgi:hypothetical protein
MRTTLSVILLCLSLCSSSALAKEGGDQYPNGGEKWLAGALPPAGSYYINYWGFYTGHLKNGTGAAAALASGTPSVNATFDALRFVQVTRFHVFGADYAVHAIVPLVHQTMYLNGPASATGLGDVTINPFILGWHRRVLNVIAAPDINLPTGAYDKNDGRTSIGANYISVEPLVILTWLPKSGWETTGKFMYNIKTTNQATNYHSGQEFHADYSLGHHFGDWISGVTGYWLKQTTDDKSAGAIAPAVHGLWDAGRRGQVFAIGPSIAYVNRRHAIFIADWQHEAAVRNRFGGDKFWFKIILPVGDLLGYR